MTHPRPVRCQAIDIVRTYAMLAMLLTHAIARMGTPVYVAGEWNVAEANLSGLARALGVVLHLATPTFALLTGFSLAFFVVSRQRKQRPGMEIDGYLFQRGLLLLVLGIGVYSIHVNPLRWTGDPGILGMFGLALWLIIPLRRLSGKALFLFAGVFALVVQVYLHQRGPHVVNPGWLEAVLLTTTCQGSHGFPVLPWLPVTLLGFAAGRPVAEGRLSLERLALGLGCLMLLLWVGLLLAGHPLLYRKHPPSLDFQLPYLAVAFFLLALHACWRQPEQWSVYRHLMVLGRCSLFFYLVHAKVVLFGLAMLIRPLTLSAPVGSTLLFGLSLLILVPMCAGVLAWGPTLKAVGAGIFAEMREALWRAFRPLVATKRTRRGRRPRSSRVPEMPLPTSSLPSEVPASVPSSP